MTLQYDVANDEKITIGMLKDFLKFVPDDYVLGYPGDDVGYSLAKRFDISTDNENKTVVIGIGDC